MSNEENARDETELLEFGAFAGNRDNNVWKRKKPSWS